VFGRQPGVEQAFHDGCHDGRPGAAVGSGRREDLDANNFLRGHEAAPRFGDGGFAGQVRQGAVDQHPNPLRARLEGLSGVGILDGYHARAGAAVGGRKEGPASAGWSPSPSWHTQSAGVNQCGNLTLSGAFLDTLKRGCYHGHRW